MERNKNIRAERLVTIATVRSSSEARRIKAALESGGLHCELRAEAALANQWLGSKTGGIKIQVSGSQARRAIEVLAGLGKSENFSNASSAAGRSRLSFSLPGGHWVRSVLGILALIALASLLSALFF
jgi:hypothetical protein